LDLESSVLKRIAAQTTGSSFVYKVKMRVSLNNKERSTDDSLTWTLQLLKSTVSALERNSPPYFVRALASNLVIPLYSNYSLYTFPRYKDDDPLDKISVSVDLGAAGSFAKYLPPNTTSTASSNMQLQFSNPRTLGEFEIKVTLTDDSPV